MFEQLKCSREGLSSEEGSNRLQVFGPNKLEEVEDNKILKFLGFMWNPLSWVMEAAAIMAIALANGGGKPPDWQDFVGIIVLLVINSTISFIEENNAGNAAAALMAGLAPKAKVIFIYPSILCVCVRVSVCVCVSVRVRCACVRACVFTILLLTFVSSFVAIKKLRY